MIHLVLDTSIYRKSPRLDSSEFKVLSYMAENGPLTLHVPYVVEREFTSQLELDQEKRISDAIHRMSSALNYDGHGPKTQELKGMQKKLEADAGELIAERSASFLHWIEQHNSIRHPLTIEHSQNAMEAYFNGHPPMKQAKSRKDIPDSFIFQQIIELKNTYGAELGLVIEDGALRSACTNKQILCWSNLSEFLGSPTAQEFLAQTVVSQNQADISKFVFDIANQNIDRVTGALEELLLSSEYATLSGDSIPGEFNEIHLNGIDVPYDVELEDIEYLGGTVFVVNVSGSVTLTYEFSVAIHDSFALDDDKYYVSPCNDHYVDVETTDEFSFVGRVELEFPKAVIASATVDELKETLLEPTIRATEVEDFEIIITE